VKPTFIPLTEPDLGEPEIEAVTNVLRRKWLSMGEVTFEFERRFAEKMGVKYAFAVTNCTAALHLAYVVAGIRSGDEVICPALSFVATANAALYAGGEVILAGVTSPSDLTVSADEIEALITPRTKVITVMHYGGFACDMDRIMSIASAHALTVIEDCAHAPFAQYVSRSGKRQFVGTIGHTGCFSFFANKNLTTGEGGMITTNDDEAARQLRLLRAHGMTQLTYDRHRGHASSYDVTMLGYNYRMDEIRSAIGLCQLDKLDEMHCRRRDVFRWYAQELEGCPSITLPFVDRDLEAATPHILEVLVDADGDRVREDLRSEGIQTSRHYQFLSEFSAFRGVRSGAMSISSKHLITLPLGPLMTREQVRVVCHALVRSCQRHQTQNHSSPADLTCSVVDRS